VLEISQIIIAAFSKTLEDQRNNWKVEYFEIAALKIK
jgi:hypothetical protein